MSRNIGIAMARGDVCCFMDDDAVPEPDWLDRLAEPYRDPTVGGVGGYTRDHTGVSFQTRALLCDSLGDSFNYEELSEARAAMANNPDLYFSQTGTNSSFRRSALLEIGGFDEHFVYFLDETDVNLRLQRAGYSVTYAPQAEIHHKYAPSHLRTEDRVPKSLYFPARSKSYFAVRNGTVDRTLGEALERVAAYELDLRDDNRWYLENGVLDDQAHRQLDQSLDRGVLAGIEAAFAKVDRETLTNEKLEQQANGEFYPFPTPLAADERIRICFLSQTYPPGEVGGIGVWTHAMAVGLAARGHEVTVITARPGESQHNTVDFEEGVWVHRVGAIWQPERTKPPLPELSQLTKDYLYTVLDEVERADTRRGFDVVSAPIWDLEGLAVLRAGRIPVVTTLHTTFKLCLPTKPDWLKNDKYRAEHIDLLIAGERVLLNETDFVLGNSEGVKQDIEREYDLKFGANTTIVPHGLSDLREEYAASDQVESLAPASDRLKILFVGRFEDRKGVPELLEAIELVAPKRPNVDFVLVGDHEIVVAGERHWTNFQARNRDAEFLSRVSALGAVDRSTLLHNYATCDIFVAPSRYESFGLIFVEAMTFAKPCIGTDIGGISEVVSNGDTGLLVSVNDPHAIAAALFDLIDNPAKASAMGRAGRQRYEERFALDRMLDGALSVYQRAKETGSRMSNTRNSAQKAQ